MHKVGLINKWLIDTLPKKDQCWTNTQLGITNHKVNLDDMQGSFIVLLLGKFTNKEVNLFLLLFTIIVKIRFCCYSV